MALWQHLEIFSLLVLLAHANTADTSSRKPLVRAFFETGCPDSQNFIENSLRPVVEHLSNLVDIELYPWGKVNIASTFFDLVPKGAYSGATRPQDDQGANNNSSGYEHKHQRNENTKNKQQVL